MADYNAINVDGKRQIVTAISVSTGVPDGDKIVATDPATGQLDPSLIPGGEARIKMAFETLAAGDIIYFLDDGGTPKMAKADATDPAKAGTAFVLAAVNVGALGTCFGEGYNTQVSGLVIGSDVFLSAAAGAVTQTPITASGQILQKLGEADTTVSFKFEIGEPIIRA